MTTTIKRAAGSSDSPDLDVLSGVRDDHDPVVAYAVMLGQAWEDNDEQTEACREKCDEAYARIKAYEAMIAVTKANTLTGAAVQLLLSTLELRNGFNPEELGVDVDQEIERQFYTLIRQLDHALLTVIHAGGVDLRALGLGPYMVPGVGTAAERANSK